MAFKQIFQVLRRKLVLNEPIVGKKFLKSFAWTKCACPTNQEFWTPLLSEHVLIRIFLGWSQQEMYLTPPKCTSNFQNAPNTSFWPEVQKKIPIMVWRLTLITSFAWYNFWSLPSINMLIPVKSKVSNSLSCLE